MFSKPYLDWLAVPANAKLVEELIKPYTATGIDKEWPLGMIVTNVDGQRLAVAGYATFTGGVVGIACVPEEDVQTYFDETATDEEFATVRRREQLFCQVCLKEGQVRRLS